MDIICKKMKCYACGKKSKKNGSGFGEYRCIYYFVYSNLSDKKTYGVYRENIHPHDVGDEYNVMLCRSCYIKNKKRIHIPDHIPEEQYKRLLRQGLKKK